MKSETPPPDTSAPASRTCPRCKTVGTGRFCSECGLALADIDCLGCGASLSPGAKFCARCGTAVAATTASTPGAPTQSVLQPATPPPQASGLGTVLPWAVAGIAFLALFAMLAGRSFNADRGRSLDAPMTALPNPALDGPFAGMSQEELSAMSAAGAGMGDIVRAPDISSMTTEEWAERLYDRIMLLESQGKVDSIQFFAPMAIQAYQMLEESQGSLNVDQRYDVGRIAEAAGGIPFAKSQADSILLEHPDNLLGLILAARIARATGNTPSQIELAEHFVAVKEREMASPRPEYLKHQTEIAAGPPPPPPTN